MYGSGSLTYLKNVRDHHLKRNEFEHITTCSALRSDEESGTVDSLLFYKCSKQVSVTYIRTCEKILSTDRCHLAWINAHLINR